MYYLLAASEENGYESSIDNDDDISSDEDPDVVNKLEAEVSSLYTSISSKRDDSKKDIFKTTRFADLKHRMLKVGNALLYLCFGFLLLEMFFRHVRSFDTKYFSIII